MKQPYVEMLNEQLPNRDNSDSKYTLVSLFSGGGGVDIGFRAAGFNVLMANEYDKNIAMNYQRNLNYAPVVCDIRSLTSFEKSWYEPTVLVGGFPCVSFSMSGKRLGTNSPEGQLYKDMIRVICELRPRMFFAENVFGVLNANDGNALKCIMRDLYELPYSISYTKIRMSEYGIPQLRNRVVFVGVREDV